MTETKLKKLLEANKDDAEMLKRIVSECSSWNSSLEEFDYQENDEEFFNNYFSNAMEAVRAASYGEYNYTDTYVKLDGYGNLETASDWQVREELQRNADYIIDTAIELKENINIEYITEGLEG